MTNKNKLSNSGSYYINDQFLGGEMKMLGAKYLKKKSAFTLIELPVARKRAFTLIELLVVIAIIGILATIIIVSYVNAMARSRDNKRKADILAISSAVEMYYLDHKQYPFFPGSDGGDSLQCRVRSINDARWNDTFTGLLAKYISTPLVVDPINRQEASGCGANGCVTWQIDLSSSDYYYTYISTGKSYVLAARLEIGTDGNGDRFYGNYLVDPLADPPSPFFGIADYNSLVFNSIPGKNIYFVGANIVDENNAPQ